MVNKSAYGLFFCDVWSLIYRSRERSLELPDLGPLKPDLFSETLSEQLDSAFTATTEGSSGSKLRRALWFCFRRQSLYTAFVLLIAEAATLFSALILRWFLMSDSSTTKLIYGMALILLVWCQSIAINLYESAWRDLGVRLKVSLQGLMLRRLLGKTRVEHDKNIISVLTGDITQVFNSCRTVHYLAISPVGLVAVLIAISVLYDWDALLGFPIIFVFVVIGVICATMSRNYVAGCSKSRDPRVNAMQQSITKIYTVKASQMERAILQLVSSYRAKELWYLLRHNLSETSQNSLVYVIKFPVTILVIAAYLLVHSDALTASYVFPLLLLYQLAQDLSTQKFSRAAREFMEFNSAIKRVESALEPPVTTELMNNKVEITKLTSNIVHDPGKLYHVFGKTGSGKTTMAESLLIALSKTELTVAFSAQKPWLFNADIRENILCGRSFDSERYWKTISACQLSVDLNRTRHGDQTQVGEDGIKLSGGQQARVAIARAVYAVADVYIFDDPFKSLNAFVSSLVFKSAISELLHQRTRILFDSKYHISLNTCDKFYRLERGASIAQLTEANDQTDFESIQSSDEELQNHQVTDDLKSPESSVKSTDVVNKDDNTAKGENNPLLAKENKNPMSPGAFRKLCRYFGYAELWLSSTTLVLLLSGQIALNLSDVWLYFWVRCTEACDQWFFFKIYVGISFMAFVLCVLRALFLRYLCYVVAKNVHKQVVANVIHAPMEFFWNAGSGEVLSRFTTDLFFLDYELPLNIDLGVQATISILGLIITIGFLFPIVIVCLLPAFLLVGVMRWLSIRIGQEMRLHYAKALATLLQKFSTVIAGLVTIRAFGLQRYVESSVFTLIDNQSIALTSYIRSTLFLVNGVAAIFSAMVSFLIIAILWLGGSSSDSGLVLYYGFQLISRCQYAAICTTLMELMMVHFYRLLDYHNLRTEQDPDFGARNENNSSIDLAMQMAELNDKNITREVKQRDFDNTDKNISTADIEAHQVGVQYKGSHHWAIKDVNIIIQRGKITGIAGRTGCGKSTFLSALLRIVNFEGTIRVGKRDSTSLPLAQLRACFAMLAQDSMIFYQETVRWNLDPYKRCSDDTIWDTLDVLGIKQVVSKLCLGLESLLKDAELSSGETRLFCFARVLLDSQGKILLLDEPTDSVDLETESKIWEAIRKRLQQRTIVVVAHSENLLKRCHQIIQLAAE